ncbi:hypothetical protein GS463_03105 [Rhodococcus hoagii]|nr:hypothetical protein [Prescottella equi]
MLVEVKGMRANALAKAGIDAGLEQLVDKVQGARNQIDKTAKLIKTGSPNSPSSQPTARYEGSL